MTWYVLRTLAGDFLGMVQDSKNSNGKRRGLPMPCGLMNALVFPSRDKAQAESERVLKATGLSSGPVRLRIDLEDRGREARLVLYAEGTP
jgi:hypothetical protein